MVPSPQKNAQVISAFLCWVFLKSTVNVGDDLEGFDHAAGATMHALIPTRIKRFMIPQDCRL